MAGAAGGFRIDDVSPRASAERLTIPVLLIHGAGDVDTPPSHSQRIYDALKGPKRLILVPGAGHNGSLRSEVWNDIERWLDDRLRLLVIEQETKEIRRNLV
jgi:pimeloyl-ACP methyl ester carboxylesterase